MKLTILISILISTFLVSCSNSKSHSKNGEPASPYKNMVDHVNLPETKVDELCKASAIADTVIYVPLETNAQSLFGNIWLLAMNDSVIVVSDRSKILAFQRNGKFIGRIGKQGKGPGEFLSITNFLLKSDTLFITSTGKKGITKYTIDGKYLEFIKLGSQIRQFEELNNGGYASWDYQQGSILFYNENWEITDTMSIEKTSKNRQIFAPSANDDQYLVKTNTALLYNNYRNDTIFEINPKQKKPAIIFNLGKKLLPDHLQVEYTGKSFAERARPYQRVNFMQTDSFIFVIQRSWVTDSSSPRPSFFVYNRNTKETKQYRAAAIYDDITGEIPFGIFFYFDNKVVGIVNYEQIKAAKEEASTAKAKEFWKQHFKNANENANYMIAIVNIK